MFLPPGPISAPIFSGSIWIVWMRGACSRRSFAALRQMLAHDGKDLQTGGRVLLDGLQCDIEGEALDLHVQLGNR
jgi:hypothetical protein